MQIELERDLRKMSLKVSILQNCYSFKFECNGKLDETTELKDVSKIKLKFKNVQVGF